MSVAKSVIEVEEKKADWIIIDDEDGGVWKYAKRGTAPADSEVHVVMEDITRRVVLARKAGQVVLRQEEHGLLRKIVVDYAEPSLGPGMLTSWIALLEYEQV